MAIVQCERGHYYEDSRDSICPYCAKLACAVLEDEDNDQNERVTQYGHFTIDDDAAVTEAYGENVDDDEKTVGVFKINERNLLTAGWLVCVDGLEKGASYPIYAGRSYVGRGEDMDVVLRGDNGICRERHCYLVYDPKSNRFFAAAGEGRLYLNGEPVSDAAELFENDILHMGNSSYQFVPFCKGERIWK